MHRRSIFFNGTTGEPLPEGAVVRRPVLADTLQAIADGGAATLYGGQIGQLLVDDIQKNGGIITLQDLKDYRYGDTNMTGSQLNTADSREDPVAPGGPCRHLPAARSTFGPNQNR